MRVEIPAIYERNDDVLRVCVSQYGEPRPTGFETKGQKWSSTESWKNRREGHQRCRSKQRNVTVLFTHIDEHKTCDL